MSRFLVFIVFPFDIDFKSSEPILISVEKDEKLATIARNNIENSRLSKLIQVINGDAIEEIPKLKSKFSMIFLDATKSEYLKYLQLIEEYGLLNKRAVVVADNVIMYENDSEIPIAFAFQSVCIKKNVDCKVYARIEVPKGVSQWERELIFKS